MFFFSLELPFSGCLRAHPGRAGTAASAQRRASPAAVRRREARSTRCDARGSHTLPFAGGSREPRRSHLGARMGVRSGGGGAGVRQVPQCRALPLGPARGRCLPGAAAASAAEPASGARLASGEGGRRSLQRSRGQRGPPGSERRRLEERGPGGSPSPCRPGGACRPPR